MNLAIFQNKNTDPEGASDISVSRKKLVNDQQTVLC